jgi:DNA polymerase III subunit gamma/tau
VDVAARQSGQIRKEAATTRPERVAVQSPTLFFRPIPLFLLAHLKSAIAFRGQFGLYSPMSDKTVPQQINHAEPYRVLARKYRPVDFSALIGQEAMVRTLGNAFETGRIPQAWMLTGVRGVGKTTTARILARALNYRSNTVDTPTIDLAVEGLECRAIIEGRHVDVVEMDAASNTGIDDIKQIIDGVRYAPLTARYKVYIIDEVHMISEKAFNALLKTLEEPPPHAKFIFATTEIRKVPVTILSRCQRFDLRRVDSAVLSKHLAMICSAENVTATPEALSMIARAGDGSVRDALSILDQAIAHGSGSVDAVAVRDMLGLADRARIIDLFERLVGGDIAGALDEFGEQYKSGATPSAMLADLAAFTHIVTRIRVAQSAADDTSLGEEERARGRSFAAKLPVPVLSRLWQMLLKGIAEVDMASRPFEAAEMVLIRLAHAAHLPSFEEALRAVADGRSDAGQPKSVPQIAPPTAPVMSLTPMSAPRMAASVSIAPQPEQQSISPAAAAKPAIQLNSLADVLKLADQNRDIQFKVLIKQYVRPVSFGEGRIEVALGAGAPKTLYNDISRRLEMWTGQRWLVVPSNEEGAATIAETEAGTKQANESRALEDPVIANIMKRFPGTRIVGITLRGNEITPLDNAPELMPDEIETDD